MSTPMVRLQEITAEVVGDKTADNFIAGSGHRLLIFTGDPKLRPEAQDVAVVARELLREHPELSLGVVGQTDEQLLMKRLKVEAVPAVLFIRNGRVVSTVSRLQDWQVYARTATLVFGQSPLSQQQPPPEA